MKAKTLKRPIPTEFQAKILRRIARSYMMVTRTPEEVRYHFPDGETIPAPTAQTLIRNGWLKGDRDSIFDLEPQRYDALKP